MLGRFIPNFGSPEYQTVFEEWINALICALVLTFMTDEGHYLLVTDANDFGIGGVLSQLQDGAQHVIAYCSRILRLS